MLKYSVALCVLSLSMIVYSLYVPVPDITERPYLLSLKLSALNLARLIGKVYNQLGLGFSGRSTDSLSDLLNLGLNSNEHYEVSKALLDGIPADIITPKTKSSEYSPALFYIHGGGWVHYTRTGFTTISTEFAVQLNSVVVLLDYPLAPEYPYPIPFEACTKALIYFIKSAKQFGVDPNKIIIGGDSAGGNLAAAVSIKMASIKDLPPLKLQVLIYPVMQALDFKTPSFEKNQNDFLVSKVGMIKAWLVYVFGWNILNEDLNSAAKILSENHHIDIEDVRKIKSKVDFSKLLAYSQKFDSLEKVPKNALTERLTATFLKAVHDPYLSPLTGATDEALKSVAPVYLLTCTRDVLRDEAVLYKHRLERVGNPVLQHDEYDFIHGMISLDMPESRRAIDRIIQFIKSSKIID